MDGLMTIDSLEHVRQTLRQEVDFNLALLANPGSTLNERAVARLVIPAKQ
jgi:hypothetical protein